MDDGLKQRLIGALVLVAIAVIFLPSLFSGEAGRRFDTRTQIPPAPEVKVVEFQAAQRLKGMPQVAEPEEMYQLLDTEPEAETVVKPVTSAVETTSDSLVKSKPKLKSVASGVSAGSTSDEVAKTSIAKLNSAGIPQAWAVQVASFKNEPRASSLVAKLKTDSYKAFVHSVDLSAGRAYRVMVGPKLDRAKAEQVKEELDASLKVSSMLVKFKP